VNTFSFVTKNFGLVICWKMGLASVTDPGGFSQNTLRSECRVKFITWRSIRCRCFFAVNGFSHTLAFRNQKTAQALKFHSHINKEKGAALVLGMVKLLHHTKKNKVNGDQKNCRLDLKTASDECWQ